MNEGIAKQWIIEAECGSASLPALLVIQESHVISHESTLMIFHVSIVHSSVRRLT